MLFNVCLLLPLESLLKKMKIELFPGAASESVATEELLADSGS